LRSQVTQLRADVDELTTALRRTEEDLQRLRNELGA
jgi:septal ring factor EnvC (AmiA/AmiB activator)